MPIDISVIPMVYLRPGELFVSQRPAKIITVLGSCISVTMFNHRLRAAAICHALLPRCGQACRGECPKPFRYISCVIPVMVERFQKYGIKSREIEVKLFGGADMFSSHKESPLQTVGEQNIETAMTTISAEGLRLKNADVGGLSGRKLLFYTHTGEVLLKRVRYKIESEFTKNIVLK